MRLLNVIGSVAEWAIEMVLEIPLLQTLSMEDVQAFELPDLLTTQDGFQTNDADG